jgi:hypothetical protein
MRDCKNAEQAAVFLSDFPPEDGFPERSDQSCRFKMTSLKGRHVEADNAQGRILED